MFHDCLTCNYTIKNAQAIERLTARTKAGFH